MAQNGKTNSETSPAHATPTVGAKPSARPEQVNAAPPSVEQCRVNGDGEICHDDPTPHPNNIDSLVQEISTTLKELRERNDKPKGLPHFVEKLDSLKAIFSAIIVIIVALFLLVGIFRGLTKQSVVIESFDLPQDLQQKGLNSQVISNELADRLKQNIDVAATSYKSLDFDTSAYKPLSDIEVPGVRTSINAITQYIGELFGVSPTHINGEVIEDGDRVRLTVRIMRKVKGKQKNASDSFVAGKEQLDELVGKAAEYVMKETEPYALASYFYEKSKTESRPELLDSAQDLARYCIYNEPREDDAFAYILLGLILHDKGDYDGAISNFQRAEGLSTNSATTKALAMVDEGIAWKEKDDYSAAYRLYEKALQMDPNSARAYNAWGWTLSEQRNYKDAITKLNKSIELDPDFVIAYENLANAHSSSNELTLVSSDYEKATAHSPHPAVTYEHWGDLLLDEKQYDEAIEKFDKAITLEPTLFDAIADLSEALLSRDHQADVDEALVLCQRIIILKPDFARAHLLMMEALGKRDKNSRRIDDEYRIYITLDAKCLACLAEAHYYFGNVLKERGDIKGAIERYSEAVSLDPDGKYGGKSKDSINDPGKTGAPRDVKAVGARRRKPLQMKEVRP